MLDDSLNIEMRAKVRLNLCAVLSERREFAKALSNAQEAAAILGGSATKRRKQGHSPAGTRSSLMNASGQRSGARPSAHPTFGAMKAEYDRTELEQVSPLTDPAEADERSAQKVTSAFQDSETKPVGRRAETKEEEKSRLVLRALALHNASVCFEHLNQFSNAHEAARAASRMAASAVPADDPLLARLRSVEAEVRQKERAQLKRAGLPVDCSRHERATQRALPTRMADPSFLPKFNATTRAPTVAEAEAAAFANRLSFAEALEKRRKEPLSDREPIASVLSTKKGLDLAHGISPIRKPSESIGSPWRNSIDWRVGRHPGAGVSPGDTTAIVATQQRHGSGFLPEIDVN